MADATEQLDFVEHFTRWALGDGEASLAHYEQEAEAFYRATGFMALGKSEPTEFGGGSLEERQAKWESWLHQRRVAYARAVLAMVIDARACLVPLRKAWVAREVAKAAVEAWMLAEANQGRLQQNCFAPGWGAYADAESALMNATRIAARGVQP